MSEIFDLSVSKICSLIQKNDLSATYVLSKYLDNIRKYNEPLNAIVSMLSEHFLFEVAEKIDQLSLKEREKLPLIGIPIAIKDLEATRGIRTTYGSEIFKKTIPTKDGEIAKKIRTAGAILIGKTNTPEFGIGSHTFNNVFGSTKNPYNLSLSSGGSSGGAACAISTDLLPIADGSDMMGSLRNPAAFNNIYGFRPTVGLIPNGMKHLKVLDRLSTSGPMGKRPEDLGYLIHSMADPCKTNEKALEIKKGAANIKPISLQKFNIGFIADLVDQYVFEDGILDLCKECLDTLSYCGAKISSIKSNIQAPELWESWTTLRSLSLNESLASQFDLDEKKHLLKIEILWEIDQAKKVTAHKYERALQLQKKIEHITDNLLLKYDYLCLPSAAVFPFNINCTYPSKIQGRSMDTYHRWMEVVTLVSLIGLPCISLPCGLNKKGLPTGMQVFGRPYSDLELLSLAQTYSKTTEKDKIRPKLK